MAAVYCRLPTDFHMVETVRSSGVRARALAGGPGVSLSLPRRQWELLARAILDNLHRFVVPAVAGPARLVPLPALATPEISANALRVAATRGRLRASRAADGTWRSTRAWVDEYLADRYARGFRPTHFRAP